VYRCHGGHEEVSAIADALRELQGACREASPERDQQTLAMGETAWLVGHPAPATEGTVALRLDPATCVVIRADDIIETKKKEKRFAVRVKKGSPIICRFEVVGKFGEPEKSGCGCSASEPPTRTILSTSGGGVRVGRSIFRRSAG
jgi:hypothetical protein